MRTLRTTRKVNVWLTPQEYQAVRDAALLTGESYGRVLYELASARLQTLVETPREQRRVRRRRPPAQSA